MTVKIGWTPREPNIGGRRLGIFDHFKTTDAKANTFAIGFVRYRREDLELIKSKGYICDVRIIGAARFGPDVTPRLIDETLGRVKVTGPTFASDEVKRALRAAAHKGNGSSSERST